MIYPTINDSGEYARWRRMREWNQSQPTPPVPPSKQDIRSETESMVADFLAHGGEVTRHASTVHGEDSAVRPALAKWRRVRGRAA